MGFIDWRKQIVALLIHSILHNEVNVKMRTGRSLLTSNVYSFWFYKSKIMREKKFRVRVKHGYGRTDDDRRTDGWQRTGGRMATTDGRMDFTFS